MKPTYSEAVKWAKEVLLAHFEKRATTAPPSSLTKVHAGCFVSLHISTGVLRGCIGTLAPTKANLGEEIRANALSAALRDPRFEPVTLGELEHIAVTVDVLNPPELTDNLEMLDPKIYGILVEEGYKKGVLLPDLEGVDSVATQIEIACRKAGIYGAPTRIYRFTVTRYH